MMDIDTMRIPDPEGHTRIPDTLMTGDPTMGEKEIQG
jgi:hypothetical protein